MRAVVKIPNAALGDPAITVAAGLEIWKLIVILNLIRLKIFREIL